MTDDLRLKILDRFQYRTPSRHWFPSLSDVAEWLIEEVAEFAGKKPTAVKQAVHRVLKQPVPDWFADSSRCKPGTRWEDFDPPGRMFRVYRKLKQLGYGDPSKAGEWEGEEGGKSGSS